MQFSRIFFLVVLLQGVERSGAQPDLDHDEGCSEDTEYTLSASFPWNKRSSVLPRFHLNIKNIAFIVHNDRFKLYREGRKASPGLAAFAETGDIEVIRQSLGYNGFIIEGKRADMNSSAAPFISNATITYNRRLLTVIGRVDKTPDWFVASTSQDLCNLDPYFSTSRARQEWKLGDYEDLILLDAGTYINPVQKNARPRPIKPIKYTKEGGYELSKDGTLVAAVGVINARRRACPVFGTSAYSVGAEWLDGPCTKCKCLDTNKDECKRQVCPPPPCEYFVFKSDVCCPVCQDLSEYLEILERIRNPDPPVIVKKPRNATVAIGGSFTLDCTAWGDPKPQIQLLPNNPDAFVHVHMSPDMHDEPGLSKTSLKIHSMRRANAGRYTCFVNSIGGSKEEHAYVTVFEQ